MDNEKFIARVVADSLRHLSSRAESPAIIDIVNKDATVEFTGIPGKRYKMTVEEVSQ